MKNIINGINLKQIANAVIDQDQNDSVVNLPNKSIIWCKIDYVERIFPVLSQVKDKNYILITHCGDREVTFETFNLKPSCIKKWFAQNVLVQDPDLIPLPIGIENHEGINKGSYTDFNLFEKEAFDFEIKNKIINKIYCNFRSTHFSRFQTTNTLIKKNIGMFESNISYQKYIESMKNFLFIASPRGNGIDSHRTWESLYFGSIPIVEKHFMYDTYKNLPIIQIDNWENLSLEMLQPYIEKYKNKAIFNNMQELTLQYWLKKIKNEINNI